MSVLVKLLATVALLVVSLVSILFFIVPKETETRAILIAESPLLGEVYGRFDPAHPGRGVTDYPGHTEEDIPKSYAMLLMAELERSRHGIEPGLPSLTHVAGRWLLDNSNLDKSGVTGWGVPVAWDAYGDDSINAASTVYAISTAIVVDALLDWMETDPSSPGEEILTVVGAALAGFADPEIRTPVGLVPYSLVATDRQYDTFNSAAYLAGQMQRFAKYAGANAYLLERAADDTINALVGYHMVSDEGSWYWRYSVQEDVSNDLAHATYIVEGLLDYVNEGGALSYRVDLDAAMSHLGEFVDGERVRAWPRLQQNIDGAARLYDLGMAMAVVCKQPQLTGMADRLKASVSLHRTDIGFLRYPPVPDNPDYVVNEYEAYLWRGLIACEVAGIAPPAEKSDSHNLDLPEIQSASGVLEVSPAKEDGVVLKQLDDSHGGVSIVRGLSRNELRIEPSFGKGPSLKVSHTPNSAVEFRDAAIHGGNLILVYYDNPSQKNYVAAYGWSGDGYALINAPYPLPSFEDPAGSTYEMIPATFLLPSESELWVVAGNLEAVLGDAGVKSTRRYQNCSRVIEAAVTANGPVALCVQKVDDGHAAPFEIHAPSGLDVPELRGGIPYNLRFRGGEILIDGAESNQDFAAMFRFDLQRLNSGWLEYGIDNTEGRVAWSQIYYLNGLMDFILLQGAGDGGQWGEFSELAAQASDRLDRELALLSDVWVSGRYRTRAFSFDRSAQLFAVQSSRLLLLLHRYQNEIAHAESLAAYASLRRDVSSLKGHIELLSSSGQQPHWIPTGNWHLVWPKGSAFYFDGLNVPFNHQNEWAYAVHSVGLANSDAAADITAHFLRRVAPDGFLPLNGVWDYWWGSAFDGWTADDDISTHTPNYVGDHGKAWISFKSIDVMSALSAADGLDPAVRSALVNSATHLIQKGELYPFVSQELRRFDLLPQLDQSVARRYVRVSSAWEVSNAAWAYQSLLQQ